MRIRRPRRQSKEITAVFCGTCQMVRDVERVEILEQPTFIFTCGHTVTLTPGMQYGLNVQASAITLYPDPNDLLVQRGAK
jgi:hypothetical protein